MVGKAGGLKTVMSSSGGEAASASPITSVTKDTNGGGNNGGRPSPSIAMPYIGGTGMGFGGGGGGGNGGTNTFESFYHGVCSELQSKGEVHAVSKIFSHFTRDEDRMKFVLEKGFASSLQWKDFNFQAKERVESQRLRNLGNQVYQKNRLQEALDLYTQSICLAPHPPPPNSFVFQNMGGDGGGGGGGDGGDGHQYEELALGFANRSAVLFQMKEYELCIRDITRAFDNSYPNNLMYKLFERKARCLKALKEFPRALEAMKSAEMWMKYSTLNETKSSSFKKDVAKQIEFLDEKVAAMAISEFQNTSDVRKNAAGPLHNVDLPPEAAPAAFNLQVGAEVPCVTSKVGLEYREGRGRLLIAKEDIPPGEILIVETPYSSIVLPEYYNSHCQSCYMRVKAPIPCWFCAKVRFCSDICRVEAWERFHKVECQQLDLILDSTLGKMAMLSMRILTSSGKIYLDYIIQKLAEEEEGRKGLQDSNRRLAFNEEEVYDAADYRTIYSLVTNARQRGVGDLFKRALMALYLLRILEATPFFYNGGSDPRNVKLADKVAMGAVLLRHLQNLPCNAHEVSEMELLGGGGGGSTGSSSSSSSTACNEIGAAVFGCLSLLNHSCDPNVVRHYYSCNGVVRSIRTIKKGEELLDNYGYHYAVMPKEERQRKLYNQYYFRCDCLACGQNWPIYQNLPSTICTKTSKDPGGGNGNSDKATLAEAGKLSKSFRKNLDSVLQGNFVEPVNTMLDYLKYLDANIARPLREYNDCQEALKHCYSATANVYHTPLHPPGAGGGGGGNSATGSASSSGKSASNKKDS